MGKWLSKPWLTFCSGGPVSARVGGTQVRRGTQRPEEQTSEGRLRSTLFIHGEMAQQTLVGKVHSQWKPLFWAVGSPILSHIALAADLSASCKCAPQYRGSWYTSSPPRRMGISKFTTVTAQNSIWYDVPSLSMAWILGLFYPCGGSRGSFEYHHSDFPCS